MSSPWPGRLAPSIALQTPDRIPGARRPITGQALTIGSRFWNPSTEVINRLVSPGGGGRVMSENQPPAVFP